MNDDNHEVIQILRLYMMICISVNDMRPDTCGHTSITAVYMGYVDKQCKDQQKHKPD